MSVRIGDNTFQKPYSQPKLLLKHNDAIVGNYLLKSTFQKPPIFEGSLPTNLQNIYPSSDFGEVFKNANLIMEKSWKKYQKIGDILMYILVPFFFSIVVGAFTFVGGIILFQTIFVLSIILIIVGITLFVIGIIGMFIIILILIFVKKKIGNSGNIELENYLDQDINSKLLDLNIKWEIGEFLAIRYGKKYGKKVIVVSDESIQNVQRFSQTIFIDQIEYNTAQPLERDEKKIKNRIYYTEPNGLNQNTMDINKTNV